MNKRPKQTVTGCLLESKGYNLAIKICLVVKCIYDYRIELIRLKLKKSTADKLDSANLLNKARYY